MRHQRVAVTLLALAGVTTGLLVAAMPSQAGLVTSCTGSASDVTVPNELFVPAGESCELTNVVINGNTTVRADANLFLTNVTINGSLSIMSNGFADLEHSSVSMTTTLTSAFGGFVEDSTLTGNVSVGGPGFFYSVRTRHMGGITSMNGETYLESSRVASNISTTGDLLTDLYDTVVMGTVTVGTASLGSVVCGSEIDGATSFTGGTTLQLGGSTPVSGCAFDVFAAGVTANSNSDVHVVGSVLRGTLACSGNSGAPEVTGNRLRGGASGDCAAPAAAAVGKTAAKARTTAAAASTSSRKDGILVKIASRSSAGQQAAKMAGRAKLTTTK